MKNSKNIIFGTGPLGYHIMQSLVTRGAKVTMVNRSGKVNNPMPEGVTVVSSDATNQKKVAEICRGARAVFHAAMPDYTKWPELFPALTQGILEGVSQTEARLIYCDNLYMYGDTKGEPLTEKRPSNPHGHKGKVRAEMAESLMKAHEAGNIKVVIGRGSDFYGPHVVNSGLGELFFRAALSGKTVDLLGDITLAHSYTYIKDFAASLVLLSEEDQALGQIWHIPNGPAISTKDMVKLVENEIGHRVKIRTAGNLMVAFLGLFIPTLKEMKEMMYEWNQPHIVDHSKFEMAFGANITPPEIAIKETLAWCKEQTRKSKP